MMEQLETGNIGIGNTSTLATFKKCFGFTKMDAGALLKKLKTKAERYVIYADICLLDDSELDKYNITFKKIPRDIARL